MTSRSYRSLPGFVRPWLRASLLGSLALGGPLLATSAHAADTGSISIIGLSLEDGELKARIHWNGSKKTLPEKVELVAVDGEDKATASLELSPEPGKVSEVKIEGAVREPWETGWAQTLIVRNPDGKELVRQNYDVSLDCVDAKLCDLKVAPAAGSDRHVLRVSSELDQTLVAIEQKHEGKEYDLVETVAGQNPSLRGEALAHSLALVKAPASEGCNCQWVSSVNRAGSRPVNPGPEHTLNPFPLRQTQAGQYRQTADGSVQVNLRLSCQTLSSVRFQPVGIRKGGAVRDLLMPVPALNTCVGRCTPSFDHYGRIRSKIVTTNSGAYPNLPLASGTETGRYHLGNVLSPLAEETIGQLYSGVNEFDTPGQQLGAASGLGVVTMAGEAWISYNGNPLDPRPTATVTNGYYVGVLGTAMCPVGVLFPPARLWDVATTAAPSDFDFLNNEVRARLGL
jgi:hypothetical protein